MSAADRLDKIESRLNHTSYHRHKDDVSALVGALRAVLDLHVATEGYLHDGAVCLECTTFGDVEVPLPCATVRVIEDALS